MVLVGLNRWTGWIGGKGRGRWHCIAAAGLAIAMAGGCASDIGAPGNAGSDESGTDDDAAPNTIDETVEAIAVMQCELVDSCRCANKVADFDCEADTTAVWQGRVDAAQAEGLTLDRACLDQTLARMGEQQCRWPMSSLGPLCESFCAVAHGDHALGAACATFGDPMVSDCAQGLVCQGGVCAEPCAGLTGLSAGQRCRPEAFGEQFDECAPDLLCGRESSVCELGAGVGEACQDGCGVGLTCEWMTNTCRTAPGIGDSCGETQCPDDLFCNWETERCAPFANEGQACGGPTRCVSSLSCSPSNVCTLPPGPGQPCGDIGCNDESVCDFNVQQCVARPGAGSDCVFNECASGLFCDTTNVDRPNGVCTEPAAFGEACRGHGQCETGYCPVGFCQELPGLNEECVGTGGCGRGLVCNGAVCTPGVARGPAVCIWPAW